MTRKQFYRRLRKVAPEFRWVIHLGGRIRADAACDGLCCPITALDPSGPRASRFVGNTALHLDLPNDFRDEVVRAADNSPNHNPHTRAALLRAVGLEDSA